MQEGDVGAVAREAMLVMLKLLGPPLMAVLVVGVVVALVQAVTQVNESSLIFVPKMIALCAVLVLLGPFMLATLSAFAASLFDRLVAVGGS